MRCTRVTTDRTGCSRARTLSRIYLALAVALLITAVALTGAYFRASPPPPATTAQGVIPSATGGAHHSAPVLRDPQAAGDLGPAAAHAAPTTPLSLPASVPVSVRAPTVGVQSPLAQVGLNSDGTIEVPVAYDTAAWYRLGPTPGAVGPAVIVGHVDSYKGPGVFFALGELKPQQIIDVTRADSTVAHFRVDAVNRYPKEQFPTTAVYGPIDYAGLRLITCGGVFDKTTKNYESNTVVFASLVRG